MRRYPANSIKKVSAVAVGVLCAGALTTVLSRCAVAAEEQSSLIQADRAAFGAIVSSPKVTDEMLDRDFTWTDSSGHTQNKAEIVKRLRSGKRLSVEADAPTGGDPEVTRLRTTTEHTYGSIGLVQEDRGALFVLHIWVKRNADWKLLVYHAVVIGATPSTGSGTEKCENPCNTVPFKPRSEDQREVIQAYQAVERAVTAHDSAAWGAHIADEFFAVTSNSDRPLDKATRMAGLDHQKEGGIAPFPLVSARMFEFDDAMVMTSRQQPQHGLPLQVTRVWFKRHGAWLEAYSYQTTIRPRFVD